MSIGKRYLFTGGGTGGHVTPNLAVIRELSEIEPDASVLYVASRHGPEREILAKRDIAFRGVPCHAFVSPRRPLRFAVFAATVIVGTLRALWVLARFRPHVVVATGGYASVPTVLAAAMLRRPIYLHEQNVRPGRANIFLARFATRVGVSFEETRAWFPEAKTVLAGYPVRRRIQRADRVAARERLQIASDQRVAFIVGGSMGARSINRGTIDGLTRLLANEAITIIHSTGLARSAEYDAWTDTSDRLRVANLPESAQRRYIVRRYFDTIEDAYAASDLVVTRAGAGAVMELATMGKPALLIPKSDAADAHQLENALSLRNRGSVDVLLEEMYESPEGTITRVYGDQLARKIDDLLADADRLRDMAACSREIVVADAGVRNATLVRELAHRERPADTKSVQQLAGSLVDESGIAHELLFPINTIAATGSADVRLSKSAGRARAILRRIGRSREETEFLLIPRRGVVTVDDEEVVQARRIAPGAMIGIGGARLQFIASVKTVEVPRASGGVLAKIVATGLGTLLSRVFGLGREILLATSFGAGRVLDLFAASLNASNLLRRIFAENAMDSAFLPSFVLLRREGRREESARLFASMLTWTLLLTATVVAVASFTADAWLPAIVPGFVAKGLIGDAVRLTRWMLPYLILVSIAALFSAALRAGNRFSVPAWSSIFFSIGVAIGVALYPTFGLEGLGMGVLIGGIGQVAIHLPTLLSRRFRERIEISFRPNLATGSAGMRKIRATAPKIVGDVAIDKISPLVDVAIVSTLAVGSVSVLYFGLLLVQLPFAILSQSINTVALKEFSESIAARDLQGSRRLVTQGVRWTVFLLLPTSIALALFAGPIVDLLLRYRNFDETDAGYVAIAVACYAAGLVGWGLQALTGRFYAARLEVGVAMTINFVAVLANIAISISLVLAGLGFAGIALGTSIAMLGAGIFRVWHLNRLMRREGGGFEYDEILPSIRTTALASTAATLIGALTMRVLWGFDALGVAGSRLFVLMVPLLGAAVAFLAAATAFGSPEMREILQRLRGWFPAPPRPTESQPPLNPHCLRPQQLLTAAERHPESVRAAAPRRRVKQFLASPSWKEKNIAVKLAGLLRLQALRYDLVGLVTDREPAPLLHRLFGGDFKNPGFVRRNAIASLMQLETVDDGLEAALLAGLADPYFEVRAVAAQATARFATNLTPATRESASATLIKLVNGSNFEVATRAVAALQATALDAGVLTVLEGLHYHPNWQVRNAVVRAYQELHRRGIIPDPEALSVLLDDILVTCDAFHPTFELKETLARARASLKSRVAPERADERDGRRPAVEGETAS